MHPSPPLPPHVHVPRLAGHARTIYLPLLLCRIGGRAGHSAGRLPAGGRLPGLGAAEQPAGPAAEILAARGEAGGVDARGAAGALIRVIGQRAKGGLRGFPWGDVRACQQASTQLGVTLTCKATEPLKCGRPDSRSRLPRHRAFAHAFSAFIRLEPRLERRHLRSVRSSGDQEISEEARQAHGRSPEIRRGQGGAPPAPPPPAAPPSSPPASASTPAPPPSPASPRSRRGYGRSW